MDLDTLKEYRNKNGYPPSILVELLNHCNLTCPYCRSSSSPHESTQLNFKTVSKLLQELSSISKWRISLSGGEPLLYSELPDLIEHIVSLDFPFCLTTNGTQPIIKLQRIPELFWKNATLKVSIDGNKGIHDSYRGKGSFEKAVNFIKEARNFIPRIIINSVLIQDGKIWGNEVYDILNELKVDKWTVISPTKFGSWNNSLNNLIENSYMNQYNYFQKLSKDKNVPLEVSFLDYSKISTTCQDIVYIRSDGEIFLPEIFSSNNFKAKTVSYESETAVNSILSSVISFIQTKKYIQ